MCRRKSSAAAGAEQAEQSPRLLEAGLRPETVRLCADRVALARVALDHDRRLLDKIGKLRVGDAVAITSDAIRGRTFKGRVRQIADYAGLCKTPPANPAVNLGLNVVQMEVELLERTPLRLGMTVGARITPGAAH